MKYGYLLDMDGVIYRGSKLIDGAQDFIRRLRETNTRFLFLTNNSQRTRRDVAMKLCRMGIDVTERDIFTCSMATARFVAQQKPGGSAYVIGEGGLLNALHLNGYSVVEENPDYVIVGEGRTMTFEMIEKAVRLVAAGARLIATNLDPNCPTEAGIRPGCGAIAAMIESATGKKAFSVGKPSPVMMRAARKELGLTSAETVMVGDTMETDILGGVGLGYRTILVLSGGTSRDEVQDFAYAPDLIVNSVADIPETLNFADPPEMRFDSPEINPSYTLAQTGKGLLF
ncbi:MAG: HAD family hydrolase [Verrucomicrobiales bacterium]|jgi:NagD protein|nr:HAD family hydrolase [Verrucomicrobiales bacterium]MBP9224402.1 HAD family hydrolase [Verrucomicrobiales bacterium]